jgi:hypothetical protein
MRLPETLDKGAVYTYDAESNHFGSVSDGSLDMAAPGFIRMTYDKYVNSGRYRLFPAESFVKGCTVYFQDIHSNSAAFVQSVHFR